MLTQTSGDPSPSLHAHAQITVSVLCSCRREASCDPPCPRGASTAQCQASDRWLNPRQRQSACLPGRLALQQTVFTATSGRKGSDYHREYTQRINQQRGREGERQGETDRQRESMVQCSGFIGALKPLHTHTHTHACRQSHTHRHTDTHTGFFWQWMWVQRAVWCFNFNLPLSPDQIHEPATKDDVTIPQLSLPLSAALHCVCLCVCVCVCVRVKSSPEVKLDSLAVSLSLILSSFKTLGILQAALKALVQIKFPLCVCETHTRARTYTHILYPPILVAGNGMGREWDREGK